jgi:hypothetical protein
MITLFDLEVTYVVFKGVLKLLLEYFLVKCALCVYDRIGDHLLWILMYLL